MPQGGSPTVRRRELGAALRRYRMAAGLSTKDVTERLLLPVGKLSRIEGGQRSATRRDVRDLCDLYGITDETVRDHLMTLARESRQPGWWSQYDLDPEYQTLVGLEAEATAISEYQSSTVPGLLQTREYAQAMLSVWRPDHTAEQREKAVASRLERQRLLTRDKPPRFRVVLDEAVLRRKVGGAAVMRGQLRLIAEMSELPSVTIQLLPFEAGAHAGMDSIFILLDFAKLIPSIVYVDGLIGQVYIERPEDVARYREVFANLSALALDPAESRELINSVRREH